MASSAKNETHSLVVEKPDTVWTPVAKPGPGSYFKYPVYMTQNEIVCPEQGYPSVVMIVHPDDWDMMRDPKTTHDGAFGRDYAPGKFYLPKECEGWIAVWKFPYDLQKVPGFTEYICPVPVGKYPLLIDPWQKVHRPASFPEIPVDDIVEKIRNDKSGGVHHLVSLTSGKRCAMITSMIFFINFWGLNKEIEDKIDAMIGQFLDVGIEAISCHQEHHALVFYRDVRKNCLITPEYLSNLLKEPRGEALIECITMNFPSIETKIIEWKDKYIAEEW